MVTARATSTSASASASTLRGNKSKTSTFPSTTTTGTVLALTLCLSLSLSLPCALATSGPAGAGFLDVRSLSVLLSARHQTTSRARSGISSISSSLRASPNGGDNSSSGNPRKGLSARPFKSPLDLPDDIDMKGPVNMDKAKTWLASVLNTFGPLGLSAINSTSNGHTHISDGSLAEGADLRMTAGDYEDVGHYVDFTRQVHLFRQYQAQTSSQGNDLETLIFMLHYYLVSAATYVDMDMDIAIAELDIDTQKSLLARKVLAPWLAVHMWGQTQRQSQQREQKEQQQHEVVTRLQNDTAAVEAITNAIQEQLHQELQQQQQQEQQSELVGAEVRVMKEMAFGNQTSVSTPPITVVQTQQRADPLNVTATVATKTATPAVEVAAAAAITTTTTTDGGGDIPITSAPKPLTIQSSEGSDSPPVITKVDIARKELTAPVTTTGGSSYDQGDDLDDADSNVDDISTTDGTTGDDDESSKIVHVLMEALEKRLDNPDSTSGALVPTTGSARGGRLGKPLTKLETKAAAAMADSLLEELYRRAAEAQREHDEREKQQRKEQQILPEDKKDSIDHNADKKTKKSLIVVSEDITTYDHLIEASAQQQEQQQQQHVSPQRTNNPATTSDVAFISLEEMGIDSAMDRQAFFRNQEKNNQDSDSGDDKRSKHGKNSQAAPMAFISSASGRQRKGHPPPPQRKAPPKDPVTGEPMHGILGGTPPTIEGANWDSAASVGASGSHSATGQGAGATGRGGVGGGGGYGPPTIDGVSLADTPSVIGYNSHGQGSGEKTVYEGEVGLTPPTIDGVDWSGAAASTSSASSMMNTGFKELSVEEAKAAFSKPPTFPSNDFYDMVSRSSGGNSLKRDTQPKEVWYEDEDGYMTLEPPTSTPASPPAASSDESSYSSSAYTEERPANFEEMESFDSPDVDALLAQQEEQLRQQKFDEEDRREREAMFGAPSQDSFSTGAKMPPPSSPDGKYTHRLVDNNDDQDINNFALGKDEQLPTHPSGGLTGDALLEYEQMLEDERQQQAMHRAQRMGDMNDGTTQASMPPPSSEAGEYTHKLIDNNDDYDIDNFSLDENFKPPVAPGGVMGPTPTAVASARARTMSSVRPDAPPRPDADVVPPPRGSGAAIAGPALGAPEFPSKDFYNVVASTSGGGSLKMPSEKRVPSYARDFDDSERSAYDDYGGEFSGGSGIGMIGAGPMGVMGGKDYSGTGSGYASDVRDGPTSSSSSSSGGGGPALGMMGGNTYHGYATDISDNSSYTSSSSGGGGGSAGLGAPTFPSSDFYNLVSKTSGGGSLKIPKNVWEQQIQQESASTNGDDEDEEELYYRMTQGNAPPGRVEPTKGRTSAPPGPATPPMPPAADNTVAKRNPPPQMPPPQSQRQSASPPASGAGAGTTFKPPSFPSKDFYNVVSSTSGGGSLKMPADALQQDDNNDFHDEEQAYFEQFGNGSANVNMDADATSNYKEPQAPAFDDMPPPPPPASSAGSGAAATFKPPTFPSKDFYNVVSSTSGGGSLKMPPPEELRDDYEGDYATDAEYNSDYNRDDFNQGYDSDYNFEPDIPPQASVQPEATQSFYTGEPTEPYTQQPQHQASDPTIPSGPPSFDDVTSFDAPSSSGNGNDDEENYGNGNKWNGGGGNGYKPPNFPSDDFYNIVSRSSGGGSLKH